MELTIDSIWNDSIQLLQPKKGYRFGLDAVLLAHFLNCSPQDRLLEIGSGNGIVLVLLNQLKQFQQAIAVEIQPALAELCRKNFARNGLDHAEVLEASIHNLKLPPQSFDLILSNPPYRKTGTGKLNPIEQKAIARHEVSMKLEDLFACAGECLKPEGTLSLILPSFREQDLRDLAQKHRFYLRELQFVHSQESKPCVLFLVSLSQTPGDCREFPRMVIYSSPETYSPEMNRLLRQA